MIAVTVCRITASNERITLTILTLSQYNQGSLLIFGKFGVLRVLQFLRVILTLILIMTRCFEVLKLLLK